MEWSTLARKFSTLMGAFALFTLPVAATGQHDMKTVFDADAAWEAFEELTIEHYAYLNRPGIDGLAILGVFEERARAAKSDADFIDVLQLVSHNFVDPHFIVGPFDDEDWSIIPTSSDIYGRYENGAFIIHEVREGSHAQRKAVQPGVRIVRINDVEPQMLIEEITGRSIDQLNPEQVEFALNIALAGKRNQERSLIIREGSNNRVISLPSSREFALEVTKRPLVETERLGTTGIIRINNSLGNFDTIPVFSAAMRELQDSAEIIIDLRNTPSGGNTIVAKAIMGHFVTHDMPYQMHTIPLESRRYGTNRKFIEYVSPFQEYYKGRVFAVGGRWTGSMGEGIMLGFEAIGATTVGTDMGDLLGALSNLNIEGSKARIDMGTESLFTVTGLPRADFRPTLYAKTIERNGEYDPAMRMIRSQIDVQ